MVEQVQDRHVLLDDLVKEVGFILKVVVDQPW
jgi:hypothetical protein